MASLLEYVGSIHIFLGPYRGNPIALYLKRTESNCQIGPKVYPWNDVTGIGETPNKAAADFEEKWKTRGLTAEMYSGPSWENGIKPEKPAPPKPAAPPLKAAAPPKPAVSQPETSVPPSATAPEARPPQTVSATASTPPSEPSS